MRRILVITSTYPRWGGDVTPDFVHELCKHVSRHNDITVVAPYTPGSKTRAIMDGIPVYRFKYWLNTDKILTNGQAILPNLRKKTWYWIQVPALILSEIIYAAYLLRKFKPQIIHAHWIVPQGLCAFFARLISMHPCSVICTVHGTDIWGLGRLNPLKKYIWNHIDGLTMVSNSLVQEVKRIGIAPKVRTAVIPMGIDTEQFNPKRRDPILRQQHRISGPFLLFVGRLSKPKGVTDLIQAMPEIIHAFPDAKLLIIGSGEEYDALVNSRNNLNLTSDQVSFLGSLPKHALPPYYATADIFIGPSVRTPHGDQEGFGLTFIEAMASGTHVVATDLPNFDDYIEDGATGYRIRQQDPQSISQKVINILSDPQPTIPKNARKFVVERFDWKAIGEAYNAFLWDENTPHDCVDEATNRTD
ncbi:glycosyltransferase family 4 protein [Oceanidesulfovibrio marinus]|uniref:Glycosyltransferase family 4 protein n=1 Tax=Oceanidesulfovibrio marinus TaxID=370038 RepID=A0A6P1ZJ10_9BACT|nr:glycosyltransferase family 4 protein [Oceanidesulfovibrio marinus]TVM35254.1 glycosyltransferase family 4 protein [Oceanidesulfovibrio marinus]